MPAHPLSDRYGGARGSRRTAGLVAIGVLIAVAVGIVLWSGIRAAQPPIAARVITFDPVSDTSVTVRLQVEATRTVSCELVARGERMATVGTSQVDVRFDASDGRRTQLVTHPIVTSDRALSVELLSCSVPGQARTR
ncbi:DUF4307 domain-containing protein [Tenggerimyces flavus]|uniref:DUF4307 domain-containing protein n=1 Tax=Tenggerimyces flavus TaxID=1708749 RepID=A0ABV7Y6H4_9ACTN|nr:DUF4307 domain-containing protein [Tenggerimyces flavus]MBM7791104.1 hypothetical protein [Tenggerimyces flavus]